MNKNYQNINAILVTDGLDFVDGKCTLSEVQIKAINDALAAKTAADETISSLRNDVAKLQTEKSDIASQLDTAKSTITAKDAEIAALKSNAPEPGQIHQQQGHGNDDVISDEEAEKIADAFMKRI